MANALGAPLLVVTTSRLLIDLNRSRGHRALFSTYSATLPAQARLELLASVHAPHREAVAAAVATTIRQAGRCVHVAVHSFTPVLAGQRRNADIGLLYDPRRRVEAELCRRWQRGLTASGLRVRRNYPYRGIADGLTTSLRHELEDPVYAGVELELNQSLLDSERGRQRIARLAAESLATTVLQTRSGDRSDNARLAGR
jgi:predicted N-formylglutamate amidohydrolase